MLHYAGVALNVSVKELAHVAPVKRTGVVLDQPLDAAGLFRHPVQPVFGQVKRYLDDNFDLQTTSEVTWAKPEAIEKGV